MPTKKKYSNAEIHAEGVRKVAALYRRHGWHVTPNTPAAARALAKPMVGLFPTRKKATKKKATKKK